MAARIEHLVTSGEFTLDGGTWQVDNNVWLVGDDHEVLVIDPAHDAEAVAAAVGDRRLVAIVCTHGHNDHVNAAPELADRTGAPILLHPDDAVLWQQTHPERKPDADLADGLRLTVAGTDLAVLHTPGTAPARSACTPRTSPPSSAGTRCSPAAREPPAGPSPTSPPSSGRSASGCSSSTRTPWCGPDTATPPRSAPRRRTWPSGSPEDTDRRVVRAALPRAPGGRSAPSEHR